MSETALVFMCLASPLGALAGVALGALLVWNVSKGKPPIPPLRRPSIGMTKPPPEPAPDRPAPQVRA